MGIILGCVQDIGVSHATKRNKEGKTFQLPAEDSKILKMLMNDDKISCIPWFWKHFYISNNLETCNDASQYRYISQITSNFTNFGSDGPLGKIRKKFDPPCEELMIGTTHKMDKGRKFSVVDINNDNIFDYNEDMLYLDINFKSNNPVFQIIQNGQSFKMEGCRAGIGGIVGIFVGVSLRQTPELILYVMNSAKKMMK